MRGPVPFHMGNHAFPTSMQTGVVLDTDARTRGIEVKEGRGQRRKSSGRGLTWLLLGWPRRSGVAFVQVRVRVRVGILDQRHGGMGVDVRLDVFVFY